MPKKLTIEEMHALATKRGGVCLSKVYIDTKTNLRWQCGNGHKEWPAPPNRIKYQKHWCPDCSGNRRTTLEEMREIAAKREGKCLSDVIINERTNLLWKCSISSHPPFEAQPQHVKKGSWCRQCSNKLRERFCRAHFESIFGEKFPPQNPDWLRNPEGNLLELDGYSKKLSLAFEHQGKQHYEHLDFYQKSVKDFEKLQRHDEIKRKLCRKNKVNLIEVPYSVPLEELTTYILKECSKIHVPIPSGWDASQLNLESAYQPKKLKKLQEIAKKRGGQCLSSMYYGMGSYHEWKCAEDAHPPWKATADSVQRGTWCIKCSGTEKKTIADAQKLAEKRDGRCLSVSYENNWSNLEWECAEGHNWPATRAAIQQGSWCHECGGSKRKTIDAMHALAARKGGVCLSKEYVNMHTKLIWQCDKGHLPWPAIPTNIKHGDKWCPGCGKGVPTIDDLNKLVAIHGGVCLSTVYGKNRTPLDWRCKRGHKWSDSPRTVKRRLKNDMWCKKCDTEDRIWDMRKLAVKKGGRCLSDVYIDSKTHLQWQCKYKHDPWPAKPNNVQQGKWCPTCAKDKRRKAH